MLKDILGLFLLPVAVVAVMLMALMVDSSTFWIHLAGIVLVVSTLLFCIIMLATIISAFRDR